MGKNILMALFAVLVMVACCVPGFSASYEDSDWISTYGSDVDPRISGAPSPTLYDPVEVLWQDAGVLESMSSIWSVPSTAISVGSHTYYYDAEDDELKKLKSSDGEMLCHSEKIHAGSAYNIPITYGEDKIYVPTLSSDSITVKIYGASDLGYIGETSRTVSGAQGMMSPVTYHNGYIYVGTYGEAHTGEDFVCFTADGGYVWGMDGKGWSTAANVSFYESDGVSYCIMASKGVLDGGSTLYVRDAATGVLKSSVQMSGELCVGGTSYYDGRVYVSTEVDADNDPDTTGDKTTRINSFAIDSSGTLYDRKVWASGLSGGTQAVPTIYNNRIYLGSGGEVAGPERPVEVISIGADGEMTSAYSIPVLTKSSLVITTAHASAENGYTVYVYCIPYNGIRSQDLCIIEDKAGQTAARYKLVELGMSNYSFHSVSITEEGYLLVKDDQTLTCCAVADYQPGDVNGNGSVNIGDAVSIARHLAHLTELSGENLVHADVNQNGSVNVGDSVSIARYLAHLSEWF